MQKLRSPLPPVHINPAIAYLQDSSPLGIKEDEIVCVNLTGRAIQQPRLKKSHSSAHRSCAPDLPP